MERIIKSMEPTYLLPSAEMVQAVFTASETEEEGKPVRSLVEEIRTMRCYVPEPDLVMVNENGEVCYKEYNALR